MFRHPVVIVLISLLAGSVFAAGLIQQQEEPNPRPSVKRVKRPEFRESDWEGIFFENLFRDGLVGERPSAEDFQQSNQTTESTATTQTAGSWDAMLSSAILENEVKRWQLEISTQLPTPVKFRTSHTEVSEKFELLAMLFAIIGQYEGDVRWKDAAHSARTAFVDAASRSRRADISAFNNVKQRSADLDELVRGGKFPDEPGASGEFDDWSAIVDRNAIMSRLELAVAEEMKEPTSSDAAFRSGASAVIHEASLIAAMGRVLQQPEMLDADDDDYNEIAQQMVDAAMAVRSAAELGNLEEVNRNLNLINQACSDCHADWR